MSALRPLLICFAGDSWEGNPHSRHHLMRRFAGEFEVFFVEGISMRAMAAPTRSELSRVWRKLAAGTRTVTVAPHLHVLRPPPIPPAGHLGHRLQLAAVKVQLDLARRRLAPSGPTVSWFSVPVAAPLRGRMGEVGSLFYYQDRYEHFSHVDRARLNRLTTALATGCDACVATSTELAADLRSVGATVEEVPHGVDLERFRGPQPIPADLNGLEPPWVGHIGLLDDHLDLDLIVETADRLPRGTVVLVGASNTDTAKLRHPRIIHLGFRPYETMPAYLAAFHSCLLPFRLNALTEAVNPIKLREYLAAGRPVVSTPLPSVRPYGDVLELADTPEAFAGAVLRTLRPGYDSPQAQSRRRDRVSGESWDAAADRLRPILRGLAGMPSTESQAAAPATAAAS